MKTSSRRGSTSCQERVALVIARTLPSSADRSVPATRTARPNTAAASTPGMCRRRHDAFDRLARLGHLVNACNQIEILEDGKIFVKREPLRHVADLAANPQRLAQDIEAEAGAMTAIGNEKAAQHTDGGGLATAICAE